jgi:hypothetical protein
MQIVDIEGVLWLFVFVILCLSPLITFVIIEFIEDWFEKKKYGVN